MRTALGVSIATVALAGDDGPPVPDELIGRLYRSPRHGINELVSGLSTSRRGSLAAFCYSRAHLPNEEKPRSFSKQAKVSLATINSTHPSGTHSDVNTASGAQCGGVAEAPVAT